MPSGATNPTKLSIMITWITPRLCHCHLMVALVAWSPTDCRSETVAKLLSTKAPSNVSPTWVFKAVSLLVSPPLLMALTGAEEIAKMTPLVGPMPSRATLFDPFSDTSPATAEGVRRFPRTDEPASQAPGWQANARDRRARDSGPPTDGKWKRGVPLEEKMHLPTEGVSSNHRYSVLDRMVCRYRAGFSFIMF